MVTENQKAVFARVQEKVVNGQKIAISQEMKGIYKDSVAKRPNKLTNSRGWKSLMKSYLPDQLLAQKHNELLTVNKITKTIRKGEIIETEESLDTQAISKGLDMAYKLKGHYAPEKSAVAVMDISKILSEIENENQ